MSFRAALGVGRSVTLAAEAAAEKFPQGFPVPEPKRHAPPLP